MGGKEAAWNGCVAWRGYECIVVLLIGMNGAKPQT